jgi:hypothetical protein
MYSHRTSKLDCGEKVASLSLAVWLIVPDVMEFEFVWKGSHIKIIIKVNLISFHPWKYLHSSIEQNH